MSKRGFLTRILISGLRPGQLVMQVLGLLFSFALLVIATQGILDFQSITDSSKEGIGEDIMVLSKPVTKTSLLTKKSFFSKGELDSLDSLNSVLEVYPFRQNQVKMGLVTEIKGAPPFPPSEVFGLECIDSEVIDGVKTDWEWSYSKDSLVDVPILLPRDVLRLSSVLTGGVFKFAEGDLLQRAQLYLIVKDSLKKRDVDIVYRARIAGFSDRISAVLAPCTFVDHLNSNYLRPQDVDTLPQRIAIKYDVERILELKEYIQVQGYETNESKLKSGEHAALFRGAFLGVGMLGFFVLLLSLTGVLLTVQLMITRSKEQIESILIQGIHPLAVLTWYIKGLAILFILLSISAFTAVLALKKHVVIPFLNKFSFAVNGSMISWETMACIGGVVVGMLVVNAAMIFAELRRMFTR